MIRRAGRISLAAALVVVGSAHVGSPNVFFQGGAGPYDIRVVVRPPSVVPGLAQIVIHAPAGVSRIVVRPVYWRVGPGGAPEGDVASAVAGQPDTYAAQLWLMFRGAYSVYVTVDGPRGTGTAIVPVVSVATGRLRLTGGLAAVLAVLGALLLAGLVTIVHAAAGEGLVAPGSAPTPQRRRRARLVAAASVPILAFALFGGARWWEAVDRDYQRSMYRPLPTTTTIRAENARPILELTVNDEAWRAGRYMPVFPDHGKTMHLFLISTGGMTTFAHLHPVLTDSLSLRTGLPPLPPGRYRVFGDVVFEAGSDLTLTSMVDVSADGFQHATLADSDDAWAVAADPVPLVGSGTAVLADGSTITSVADTPLVAGREVMLRFSVRDAAGNPAVLEPYMGMAAHAVISRSDGSVFIHLHPMGTISAAAQRAFVLRDRGDTAANGQILPESVAVASHAMPVSSEISLPYGFPKSGRYRMWVEVKRQGKIFTGVFDADVRDDPAAAR